MERVLYDHLRGVTWRPLDDEELAVGFEVRVGRRGYATCGLAEWRVERIVECPGDVTIITLRMARNMFDRVTEELGIVVQIVAGQYDLWAVTSRERRTDPQMAPTSAETEVPA